MGPGGSFYIDTWSSLTEPPRTVLHSGDGAELGVYREPDRSAADEYDILPTRDRPVQGARRQTLYGRLIKPAGFEPGKKYPVMVTVYGGPGVDLPVHNAWQGISIDQVLAHKGYVVWQCENRGGMGRGHAFETAVYHKLGVTELADQVAGVQVPYLAGLRRPGPHRHPRLELRRLHDRQRPAQRARCFQGRIRRRARTNWLNYDTIYTERYMGLPKDNPDGYRDTALPPKAENLKGKLMLVHNFEDDNVLFQNSLQLTDALQLAGKQFEYMLYPQKSHGVTGPAAQQMNRMMLDFFDRALQ